MNYNNTLTEITSIDTVHLSEKGSAQVEAFKEFVTPLIPDIKKGEAAKAQIAQYYLDHKDTYTDGAVKLLEPLVDQLGVSSSYISQIKSANTFKNSLHNKGLAQYVDEHPITTQYYLSKAPHEKVMEAFLSGEHVSKRQAVEFTRVKNEDDKVEPTAEVTKTEFQEKCERAQAMIDDPTKGFIRTLGAAEIMMTGTRKDRLAAAVQTLYDLNYQDKNLEKLIEMVKYFADEALKKPAYIPKGITQHVP